MKIIGITGTNGSGKGSLVAILKKRLNITHVSARQMILDLAKSENVKIENRDDLREFNEKRNKEGKSLIQEFYNNYKNGLYGEFVIFESIRRVSEINELKKFFGKDFLLIGVDADINVRYERNLKRGTMSDNVTFEKFIEQEKKENESSDDHQMNLSRCLSLCDIVIKNVSDLEYLEKEINLKILPKII